MSGGPDRLTDLLGQRSRLIARFVSELTALDAEIAVAGVTVHAGLLKLAFTRSIANADGRALYQYAYDGNALSPATVSSNLAATERVGLGVLDGELFALFQKA